MGPLDRTARVLLGAILIPWAFVMLNGIAQWIVLLFATFLIISATIGFCGLYTILGINTKK